MPTDRRTKLTAERQLEAVAAELRGQRLADVVYYPLSIDGEGTPEDWDWISATGTKRRWAPTATIRAPDTIRLGFRGRAVWIIGGGAAPPGSATKFWLGTEDVMVAFTPAVSSQIGIPDPIEPPPAPAGR